MTWQTRLVKDRHPQNAEGHRARDPSTARAPAPYFTSSPLSKFQRFRTPDELQDNSVLVGELGYRTVVGQSPRRPQARPRVSPALSLFHCEEEGKMVEGQCPKPTCFPVTAAWHLDLGCGVMVMSLSISCH